MNDVNVVIDNLASKLGVAANVLIPEMSRYYIAKDATMAVIFAFLVCVSVMVILKAFKKLKEGDASDEYFDGDPYQLVIVITSVVALINFIIFSCELTELIGLLASPTGATIDKIINCLK